MQSTSAETNKNVVLRDSDTEYSFWLTRNEVVDKLFDSWLHSHDLQIPVGKLNLTLNWCIDNCKFEWGWTQIPSIYPNTYVFLFQDGSDATAFSLKWH